MQNFINPERWLSNRWVWWSVAPPVVIFLLSMFGASWAALGGVCLIPVLVRLRSRWRRRNGGVRIRLVVDNADEIAAAFGEEVVRQVQRHLMYRLTLCLGRSAPVSGPVSGMASGALQIDIADQPDFGTLRRAEGALAEPVSVGSATVLPQVSLDCARVIPVGRGMPGPAGALSRELPRSARKAQNMGALPDLPGMIAGRRPEMT